MKISASRRKRIRKEQFKAFSVDHGRDLYERLSNLNNELPEDKQFNIVVADYEADVYIAKQKDAIVVSGDGDYYFHSNIDTYARFLLKGNILNFILLISIANSTRIMIFKKKLITKKLNLNDGQLLALGILSGNDYA